MQLNVTLFTFAFNLVYYKPTFIILFTLTLFFQHLHFPITLLAAYVQINLTIYYFAACICSAHQSALNAVSFCSAVDVPSDDPCANTHTSRLSSPELTNHM